MIRAYLLLGTTAMLGNGMTRAPVVNGYRRLVDAPSAIEFAIGDVGTTHSLLGQDVLSRLGAITIAGDRLGVRPIAS